jgi:hypothetical protein
MHYSRLFYGWISAFILGLVLVLSYPGIMHAAQSVHLKSSLQFQPPDNTALAPDNRWMSREEGASANALPCNRVRDGSRLIALVPDQSPVLTHSDRPDFVFYLPAWEQRSSPTPLTTAEFALLNPLTEEVLSRQPLQLSGEAGFFRLPYPEHFPALAVGEPYRWEFIVPCTSDPLYTIALSGIVQRVNVSDALANQLAQMTVDNVRRRAMLYATAGIWPEALTTIMQARQDYPDNLAIAADWRSFLASVGLEELAEIPLHFLDEELLIAD